MRRTKSSRGGYEQESPTAGAFPCPVAEGPMRRDLPSPARCEAAQAPLLHPCSSAVQQARSSDETQQETQALPFRQRSPQPQPGAQGPSAERGRSRRAAAAAASEFSSGQSTSHYFFAALLGSSAVSEGVNHGISSREHASTTDIFTI